MPGHLCILLVAFLQAAGAAAAVGVAYGRQAASLPPPPQVAQFLARDTVFDRVKLLDADPLALQAFAGTGLAVDVAVPNALVPRLAADLGFARRWVLGGVAPYAAATNISRVFVGDEVLSQANETLRLGLVAAMQNLHTALAGASLSRRVEVSTAHSLGVLAASVPPSAGGFRDAAAVRPLLSFLRATGAPFMVKAYPFYSLGGGGDALDFALFRPNAGVMDNETGLVYSNALDAQLDAVHCAMARLGFSDVDVVVAETGWPSAGEEWEAGAGAAEAREYNGNAVRHLGSGVGTPLMPNRTFEVSVYSLFNENLKAGPASEKNFGLFHADMTPVYDIGFLSNAQSTGGVAPASSKATPSEPNAAVARQWCVAKPAAEEMVLQDNIDFACGQGVDCSAIRPGGACYDPDTVQGHAAYAMNQYFQSNGRHEFDCDFGQTGVVTTADPSFGRCKFT